MKYYLPVLSIALFAVGFFLGGHFKVKEFGGLVEHNIVREAAMDIPLHTVVLTRLREGKTQEAIETLESSLGVKEVLLDTCEMPSCVAASSRMVEGAKAQLREYRERFPDRRNHN